MEQGRRILPPVIGVTLVAILLGAMVWSYEIVRVAGGSMRPALNHGDVTVVSKRSDVDAGDIVLMQQPGRSAVLHRALRRSDGGWLTKGDANPVPDWAVAPDSWMRGPVVAVIPVGRWLDWWQ